MTSDGIKEYTAKFQAIIPTATNVEQLDAIYKTNQSLMLCEIAYQLALQNEISDAMLTEQRARR